MKYHLMETEHYSLASITIPTLETVTAYLTIPVHEANTPADVATHILYSDALLSGAGAFTRSEFLHKLGLLGATVSVSLHLGELTISIKATASVYKQVLSLVSTMLLKPRFSNDDLRRIKQTTINLLKETKEDSKSQALAGLTNTLYGSGDRRFSHDEDLLISETKRITPKQLRSLHNKILAGYITCSVAGTEATIAETTRLIQSVKKQHRNSKIPFGIHQQKPPQPRVVLKEIPGKQNIDFSIGAPLPITYTHPDYLPLVFGIAVLGKWGGFAGRLMSTVRETEGLTYAIYARTETVSADEQGYWRIMTFFSPDKAIEGLRATFREVTKLYNDGITPDELVKFKTILHTMQTLQGDSTARLIADLHGYHTQNFSLEEMTAYKARLLSVTQEEVNDAVRRYLNPESLTISAAGPISKVKKELLQFKRSMA